MFNEIEDAWQRSLSPSEEYWGCMKHLRAAVIRREIADEIPLYLASTIAAYIANEHEITRTHIGIVTVPMPKTTKQSTIHTQHKGE